MDTRELAQALKAHPKFQPTAGMVGMDGSVIVRVGGTLGPVAAYIFTAEADDEGIELIERRIDDGWLPDLTHPATVGVLFALLGDTGAAVSLGRDADGRWHAHRDLGWSWADIPGEAVAKRLIYLWSAWERA
jgi:hypothetical protein